MGTARDLMEMAAKGDPDGFLGLMVAKEDLRRSMRGAGIEAPTDQTDTPPAADQAGGPLGGTTAG